VKIREVKESEAGENVQSMARMLEITCKNRVDGGSETKKKKIPTQASQSGLFCFLFSETRSRLLSFLRHRR
jgi:hypothetical protein